MVRIERAAWGGWSGCVSIDNGLINLIVTTDVGPRILHFGRDGGENQLAVIDADQGQTGGDEYRFYGGHRLWHAPESIERTYVPDNQPVEVETIPGGVTLTQPVESSTRIQKQITLVMADDQPQMRLTHRLINQGLWPVELAPWALTMCAPSGVGILPLPPLASHDPHNLLPHASVHLWPYTRMNDPRWTWGERFILLRQDENATAPQKVGAFTSQGWIACARAGVLFVKTFSVSVEHLYPDRGSTAEMFTDHAMLEIETLGPLITLQPGQFVDHTETWTLLDGIPQPETEHDVLLHILPHVEAILDRVPPSS